jgi:TolB protein
MPYSTLKNFVALLLVVAAAWSTPAQALLTIRITQGVPGGTPVAVVPFSWTGTKPLPESVSAVIDADLARSGLFTRLQPDTFPGLPHLDREVVFKDWRLVKAEALVIGNMAPTPDGRVQIEFRLYDVFKETQLAGYRYVVAPDRLRAVAHTISDIIYEKLTGRPGVFTTRVAYISREGAGPKTEFKLQIADSDGANATTIMRSKEPVMSPAWSPDGKRIAYVSFEERRPTVYVQNLADGSRQQVAAFEGINSAPAWAPDSRRLALTLSRDGNTEIYVLDIEGKALKRITFDRAIDTEAAWSPDGRSIVFTSDRAGQPQLYRVAADGGRAERLTFEGTYNARPAVSPDGGSIVYVSRRNGRYNIALLNLQSGQTQILTDGRLDESPSFAPNGSMILYATEHQGRGVLASVSADGRVRQLYTLSEGDIREPAWASAAP